MRVLLLSSLSFEILCGGHGVVAGVAVQNGRAGENLKLGHQFVSRWLVLEKRNATVMYLITKLIRGRYLAYACAFSL